MSETIKREAQSSDHIESAPKFNINDRIRFKSRVDNEESSINGKEARITRLPSGEGSFGYLYYIKFDDGVEIGAREEELEIVGSTTI